MSPLFFLIRKTLKNYIKGIAKKPVTLIGYILVALFIIAMVATAFLMPSSLVRSASPALFTGIMLIVFSILYFTSLKLGIDKGSTYFRMADVNLAFTAPILPNNILLYGFIKQIGGTMLLLFVAICQIANIKNNFEMKSYGVWMLLLAVLIYSFAYPLLGMLIYSWSSKVKARKRKLKQIFNVAALLVVVFFLLSVFRTGNIGTSIEEIFSHPLAGYFPIIGWTGSIASAAVTGFSVQFWVGAIGMVLVIVTVSVCFYRLNLDYYEDVLEGSEYMDAAVKAKCQGNNMSLNLKVKNRIGNKLSGRGAYAIFSKQVLEMRKTSYFLFFDIASVTVIVAGILFKFLMPDGRNNLSMFLILCFSVYMLLILQVKGRFNNEMDKPYVYLIPASPYKKLFYTTLAEHVKNLIDGAILFVLSGIIFKADVPVIFACIINYASFGAVFIYTGVLCKKLFGYVHSKAVFIYIKIIAVILLLVPGIIAAFAVLAITESELLLICAIGGWSLILAATLFIFSSGIFNDLESAG